MRRFKGSILEVRRDRFERILAGVILADIFICLGFGILTGGLV